MKTGTSGLVALACIAAAAYGAILAQEPPPSAGASAAQTFSAGRAAPDVAAIAERPHPIGSADHDRVQNYIVERLRSLGVEPELQQTTAVFARDGVAGRVTNILARLKGTANTRAVMLAAHYDSVPSGPGAGDNASGVAVLLETLRALRAGSPLANDVIFLITDGEEVGLLGAAAFTAEHRWAKDVGLVLNFDARGNSGPALMFETTPGNGRLIELLRENVPHPRASSLTYAVYQRMPNDTDLTVFRGAGLTGLNFAFIGNLEAYHTRLDTPGNLSAATLQQQGSYALALARAAGNADLRLAPRADRIYFNTIGSRLAVYPQTWAMPLTVVALVLLLLVLVIAFRRGMLTPGSLALAMLVPPLAVGATAGLALLMVAGARWLHRDLLPAGSVSMSNWYAATIVALAVAIAATLAYLVCRRVSAVALAAGALLWWVLLAFAVSVLLPGASFLFVWPSIFIALAVGSGVRARPGVAPGIPTQLAALVLLLLAIVLVAPVGYALHVVFPLHTVGTIVAASYTSLVLCLIAEPLHRTITAFGWRVPAAALGVAVVLFLGGAIFTRYSAAHPQVSNLLYLFDADATRAYWASRQTTASSWTEQVLTGAPALGDLPAFISADAGAFLHHEAPLASLRAPLVDVESDATANERRALHLRIRPGQEAWQLRVRVTGADVIAASVNGNPIPRLAGEARASREEWNLRFFDPGVDGIDLVLALVPGTPFTLRTTAYLLGLPALVGGSPPPRPENVMPNHEGDLTLITHAAQFTAAARSN